MKETKCTVEAAPCFGLPSCSLDLCVLRNCLCVSCALLPCWPGCQQSLLAFVLVLLWPAIPICSLFILSPLVILQISMPIWAKRIKFISKSRKNTSQRRFYHQVGKSPHLIIKCLLSSMQLTKQVQWRLSHTEGLSSEKVKQNWNSKMSNCYEELKNSLLFESTTWKWQLAVLSQ